MIGVEGCDGQKRPAIGALTVTVGARDRSEFERVLPLLRCMAADVTYCGRPGAGTLVKLLNNLIVFESVVAMAEAATVARRSRSEEVV